jgi:protein-disulfide isomerase
MISEEAIALMQRKHKRHRLLIRLGVFIFILILIPLIYILIQVAKFYPKVKSGELTSYNQVRLSRAITSQSATGTMSSTDFAMLIPTSTVPELGNKNAPLKIVEFVDYQCAYSKEMLTPIRNIMNQEQYSDKIYFVVRDYPVTEIHSDARNAAHASACVLEQGQPAYWRFQALLFSDQSNLSLDGLRAKANLARINTARFDECMNSRRYDLTIDNDIEFAKRIGVQGTPTMFVNGIKVEGSMSEADYKVLIDSALSQLVQ